MKKPHKIRFAIAQMNPIVGDYAANERKIKEWISAAAKRKADFVVFPELALSGYPCWDLANKQDYVDRGLKSLNAILRHTKNTDVNVILGYIDQSDETSQSYNALAWIRKGKLIAKYYKRLLPTYDVFLEDIFFEPGTETVTVPWESQKVGLTICEDIWDESYTTKPISELADENASLILNISCSPYYRGVAEKRDTLLKNHAQDSKVPILYVNQVGGQDDLIFDGRSLFCDAKGRILFRAPAFQEGLFFYDWNPAAEKPFEVPHLKLTSKPEETYHALVLGIRDYCRKNGFQKVLIGLSGGIDSALVAALATDALGSKAVTGITMPGPFSSKGSWQDAEVLAKRLKIDFRVHPIKEMYEFFMKKQKVKTGLASENLQARLRGLTLMYYSNLENRLLLSTGNKSELAMGYCTLYGDMAGGICVLGDVYKTDVYRLAWYRNKEKEVIPRASLLKAPSAELRPNQKDEDSLPKYEILDQVLHYYIEKNYSRDEIVKALKSKKISLAIIDDVMRRVDHNEYKRRQTPPILRVTEKAWFGRRMPITSHFRK